VFMRPTQLQLGPLEGSTHDRHRGTQHGD
jgi:hypothetical protein